MVKYQKQLPFLFDGYGLGIAQELLSDPEEGRTVTNPFGIQKAVTFLVVL
jgi:hypothetical protein